MIRSGWLALGVALLGAASLMLTGMANAWLWTSVSKYHAAGCDEAGWLQWTLLLPIQAGVVGAALGLTAYVSARKAERPVPGPALAACLGSGLTLLATPLIYLSNVALQSAACSYVVDGRPVRGPEPTAERVAGVGWGGGGDDPRWRRVAEFEHASVGSFALAALDLIALDAPEDLVDRCLDAAAEEVEHAVLAMELGSTGETFAPWTPPRKRTVTRARVAWSHLVDGWINEGMAARRAETWARDARSPEEARVCERIAREERGHAALGKDVALWALFSRRRGRSSSGARAEATLRALAAGSSADGVRRALQP